MAKTIYVGGSGRFSFEIEDKGLLRDLAMVSTEKLGTVVRASAAGLASITRTQAPIYTGRPKRGVVAGALRAGIVPSPGVEPRACEHGNIVKYVWMDPGMNDTFVKTANGKRYYYPASQEYGFRTRSGGRKGGLYFMRNTAVSYYPAHEARVAQAVDEILKEIEK